VVASQIVLGLQTIVSRQVNLTQEPAVVTIGGIEGGNRFNIIPDQVAMIGTIRTFGESMRDDIHRRVRLTAERIAEATGARAQVEIERIVPVMVNDPGLTERMLPTLRRVAADGNLVVRDKTTGYEDFSYFAQEVPALFIGLGISPVGTDLTQVAYNHSPRFYVDESGLLLGVRALTSLTLDYLTAGGR
jgi:amidohydrolase